MTYWWTTAHWQHQYAMDVECSRTDISINSIKETTNQDDRLCYCPAWTSGRIKSHPKINVCKKSIMDHFEEATKKKRKRRAWMFCKICHKYNHDTD
jgi:hypothetical protein